MSRRLFSGNELPSSQTLPNVTHTTTIDPISRLVSAQQTCSGSPQPRPRRNLSRQAYNSSTALNVPMPKASNYYMLTRHHDSSYATRPANMVKDGCHLPLNRNPSLDNPLHAPGLYIHSTDFSGADTSKHLSASPGSLSRKCRNYTSREQKRMHDRPAAAAFRTVKDVGSVVFAFAKSDAREREAASSRDNGRYLMSTPSQSKCELSITKCSLLPCSSASPTNAAYYERELSAAQHPSSLWPGSFCRFVENKDTPHAVHFSNSDLQVGDSTTHDISRNEKGAFGCCRDSRFVRSAGKRSDTSMKDNAIAAPSSTILLQDEQMDGLKDVGALDIGSSPLTRASSLHLARPLPRCGGPAGAVYASVSPIKRVGGTQREPDSSLSIPPTNAKVRVAGDGEDGQEASSAAAAAAACCARGKAVPEFAAKEANEQSTATPLSMALSTTCDLSWSAGYLNSDSFYSDEVESIIIPEFAQRFVRDGAQRHYTHAQYQH